jgi:drug/metabolite transporter (DMT)-like permease
MVNTAPNSSTTLWLCVLAIFFSCFAYFFYIFYLRDYIDSCRQAQTIEKAGGNAAFERVANPAGVVGESEESRINSDNSSSKIAEHNSSSHAIKSNNSSCCGFSAISNRAKGMSLCVVGVLILSPDAFLLRVSGENLPGYTVLFSKYMISVLVFLAYILFETKFDLKLSYEKIVGIGWLGCLAGFILGISYVFFTLAIQMGIVANVLVIVASNPIVSAILGYFAYKEAMNLRMIITCIVCFVAILIVFVGDMKSSSSFVGNIHAVFASLTLGMYFSMLRYIALKEGDSPDMIPCNIVAGLVVGIVALIFGGAPVMADPLDGLYLLLQGVFTVSLSFAMITMGPTYISATEVSLYMFIETILGPVWVYLGGYDVPPKLTVVGGVILILSLGINSLLSLREERLQSQNPDKSLGLDPQSTSVQSENQDDSEEPHNKL